VLGTFLIIMIVLMLALPVTSKVKGLSDRPRVHRAELDRTLLYQGLLLDFDIQTIKSTPMLQVHVQHSRASVQVQRIE
jgi:hypothetical protein